MRKFELQQNFNVYRRKVSTTPEDIANERINIVGNYLIINRLAARNDFDTGYPLSIKFNEPVTNVNDPRSDDQLIEIVEGMEFFINFDSVYLYGVEIVGNNDIRDIEILYKSENSPIFRFDDYYPARRYVTFSGGSEKPVLGDMVGVYITQSGNLDVVDHEGNYIDFDNVISGMNYPISFRGIRATTTANGIIYFRR